MSTITQPAPEVVFDDPPHWRGINHLALVTADMDATVRFYHGVLGARLVATIGTPELRHYFFELAPQCTIAFFEYTSPSHEPLVKAAGIPDERAPQFDHVAFNLADDDALEHLRHRLERAGCDVTEIVDHGIVRSIYFDDPNGISLEASWWVLDSTARAADYDDSRFFADPDPVPALEELRATGRLMRASSA